MARGLSVLLALALSLFLITTGSALPLSTHQRRDIAAIDASLYPRSIDTSDGDLERRVAKPPKKAAAVRNTERRAKGLAKAGASRSAKAKARVAQGKPKATNKERGRTGGAGAAPAGTKRGATEAKGANKAMKAHVDARRQAKAKQHGIKPGATLSTKKAARVAERKENREAAKKQKFQAGKAAGKYDIGLDGKPQNHGTVKPKVKQANAKARLAKYNALTADQKKAKSDAQAATRAKHVADGTKAANRANRVTTKAADRAARKATSRGQINNAKAAYQASLGTGTVPGRGAQFNTPQGKNYNGKDVRQAIFTGHLAAEKGGVGYKKNGADAAAKDKHPKTFNNTPFAPGSTLPGGRPIPGMTGPGREFGLSHNKQHGYDGRQPNPTEARVITQPNASGVHEFKGVVAHPPASDEHVLVPPTR